MNDKQLDKFRDMLINERNLLQDEIKDISVISDCTRLSVLWADCNNISDLSPLEGLDQLYEIEINNNYIYDLSALKELDSLQS